MRKLLFSATIVLAATNYGYGQQAVDSDDVASGHKIAIDVCANCHLAAPDQPNKPILRPPASSFDSIAQKKTVTAKWLQEFLKTTHRGLDKPEGMPNLELLDFQARQVANYIMSLRKNP